MNNALDIFGLLFAAVLIVIIGFAVREPLRRTFFERGEWDFFVSHKREDKPVVIPIVEILKKRNFLVWIDSHEINEEQEKAGFFREPISVGIERSSFALLFTSKLYCGSDFCMDEADFFIKRFSSQPKRIIEISLEQNGFQSLLRMPKGSENIDFSQFQAIQDKNKRYEALVDEIISKMGT